MIHTGLEYAGERYKAHTLFDLVDIADYCEWFGTEWVGEGVDARLLTCGESTVGKGLFCDPIHKLCFVASVCERHKKTIQDWSNHEKEL